MGCNTIYPDCDMNRWESQCSSYIVDADNYYTKTEVDAIIESGVTPDLSDYYTKEETDSAITSAITAVEAEIPTVPTSNTAFTNDAGYITGVDLSNYATLDDVASGYKIVHDEVQEVDGKVQTVSGDVQGISTEIGALYQEVQGVYGDLTAHTADTSIHLTSGDVQNQISGKTDNTDFSAHTADTSIHLTSGDVQNAISGKADYSDIKTYSAGNGIKISTANTISLDMPIYKGNSTSVIENENQYNKTYGAYSHVEGLMNKASGYTSHVEGEQNIASGASSHAEGKYNTANGEASHAGGYNTITYNRGEFASGMYNVSNTSTNVSGETIFSVGNGNGANQKHNSIEIRMSGDIYIPNTNTSGVYYEKPMVKLQDTVSAIGNLKFVSLTQADYDALVVGGTTDANTIYFIKNS